jgi:hypothetical protein
VKSWMNEPGMGGSSWSALDEITVLRDGRTRVTRQGRGLDAGIFHLGITARSTRWSEK